MPDDTYKELDQKAFEVILKFKPNGKIDRKVSDEILRLKGDIKKAISYLTKEEQEIFEFRYFYGINTQEISKRLDVSVEQIDKVLSMNTLKIKKIIADGFPATLPLQPEENSVPKSPHSFAFVNKILGLGIFLLNIGLLVGLIFGVYFLLQKFVFSEMPTLPQMLNKAGTTVQEQVDNSKVLNKIAGDSKYFDVGDPNNLRISGSTSLLPVARRWENAFNIEYPKYQVSLVVSDSDAGINSLIEGKIDIANSSRPLSYLDHKQAQKSGKELAEYRVAIDALVVVVNKSNPLKNISLDELKAIFSGKVTNWKKVGGLNISIIPIAREKGSGTNNFVRNRVLGGDQVVTSVRRINSNEEIIKALSATPGAISCINSNNYNLDNDNIKYLLVKSYNDSLPISPFEGNKLNELAIRYGDYPFAHYLYLITLKEPPGKASDFVDWISTAQGQKIVRYSGLIPVYED